MTKMDPWKTGIALALTMAVSYIVCAVLYSLWPERGLDFLNALFHGLDFRKLETARAFRLSIIVYPLTVLVVWGFVVGSLFAFIHNFIHRAGE